MINITFYVTKGYHYRVNLNSVVGLIYILYHHGGGGTSGHYAGLSRLEQPGCIVTALFAAHRMHSSFPVKMQLTQAVHFWAVPDIS